MWLENTSRFEYFLNNTFYTLFSWLMICKTQYKICASLRADTVLVKTVLVMNHELLLSAWLKQGKDKRELEMLKEH